MQQQSILILDFGSRNTQLIARGIRELNIYCEIHPYHKIPEFHSGIRGVIFSGASPVLADETMQSLAFSIFLSEKIPLLAICFETPSCTETEKNMKSKRFKSLYFQPGQQLKPKDIKQLHKFSVNSCGCRQEWTPEIFVKTSVASLKKKLGNDKVVLGLSGGVDSSVAAVLLHKAIGKNLFCIFVDNGLLRKNEFEKVIYSYRDLGLNVIAVNASGRFLDALKGIINPEEKRKTIGKIFIEVFDEEAHKIKDVNWLGQGTIYPDVIESVSVKGSSVAVKSHHNVGGLPKLMKMKVVEPLATLFKDEVRKAGRELGLPSYILDRHPFPGPGLGVRILGEISADKLKTLREVDDIFIEGLRKHGLYDKVWQAAAILLPIQSVGYSDEKRTYENAVVLRAVQSTDAMTAEWSRLPNEFLGMISNEIIQKVKGVNRVVYDISSKPPATIEWE